ncbi:hypothetical protein N0B44_02330 [Roseibacterium beibuensis]|uniref:Chitin-binding type-2 domain-containing protein n=1 Tax=[Roseibacterium] beibuensis TaxID=1193142 RepID=A0ABP9KYC9_9RHOB|nr:hypothetical protein [Roseibacterium beibuensis]MCS6621740.1 hypothetical protein [Roseibacterium beibuensis]
MTKLKTLLAAAALIAAPGFALADCPYDHQVTMSCADGTSWDSESQSCVPSGMS